MSSGGEVAPTLESNLQRPAACSPADIPGPVMTSPDLDQTKPGSAPTPTFSETLASISLRLDLVLTLGASPASASPSDPSARSRLQIPVPIHPRRT